MRQIYETKCHDKNLFSMTRKIVDSYGRDFFVRVDGQKRLKNAKSIRVDGEVLKTTFFAFSNENGCVWMTSSLI